MKKNEVIESIMSEVENDPRCQPGYIQTQAVSYECLESRNISIGLKKYYHETVQLNSLYEEPPPLVQYFEPNKKGDDYVVGDIHNQFNQLIKQLNEVGFNKEKDRLFAVGDLIDRGRDNDNNGFLAYKFLKEKWFFSVMGNHEEMCLSMLSLPPGWNETLYRLWHQNGGSWLLNLNNDCGKTLNTNMFNEKRSKGKTLNFDQLLEQYPELKILYAELSKLPFVIQIGQDIGIVHAEMTVFIDSWDDLINRVNDLHFETLSSLLWGRKRVQSDVNLPVTGIKRIYCGHTPLAESDDYSNHRMIDIGAYLNPTGQLHIERINYDEV